MGERDTSSTKTKRDSEPGTGRDTVTTGTKNGGGRGTGGDTPQPDQGLPKLVAITVPNGDEKKDEPKKGRGRPKGASKPKVSASAPKKADSSQCQMLLLTISGIIASRPGLEPFMLTPQEAAQIADPLTSILSKSDTLAGISGEYADHVALLLACVTIMIPKYLLYKATKPKKEKEAKSNGQPTGANAGNEKGQVVRGNKPSHRQSTNPDYGQTFNGNLSTILSPIAGF